jgi:hypothetical protein
MGTLLGVLLVVVGFQTVIEIECWIADKLTNGEM